MNRSIIFVPVGSQWTNVSYIVYFTEFKDQTEDAWGEIIFKGAYRILNKEEWETFITAIRDTGCMWGWM